MATTDPTLEAEGFEGFVIADSPQFKPKSPTGFEGFGIRTNSPASKSPTGFEGFILAYSDVERFFKITDYRGNPLKNVTVIAQNTGGDVSAITGSNGIVALEIDVSGTITIVLEKEKTFKNLSYEYASEPTLKEIILQPPLL